MYLTTPIIIDKNENGDPRIFYGAGLSFRDGCRLLLKWRHAKDDNERKSIEEIIWHNQQSCKNQVSSDT